MCRFVPIHQTYCLCSNFTLKRRKGYTLAKVYMCSRPRRLRSEYTHMNNLSCLNPTGNVLGIYILSSRAAGEPSQRSNTWHIPPASSSLWCHQWRKSSRRGDTQEKKRKSSLASLAPPSCSAVDAGRAKGLDGQAHKGPRLSTKELHCLQQTI